MVSDARRAGASANPVPVTPPAWRMVGRAATLRCCVCGGGGLFRRYTVMVKRCGRCGYLFERSEGQFIGAVGVNTVVTFALVFVVLIVGIVATAPNTPAATLSIITGLVAVIVPIVFYPFSKTLWTAIDLMMTPLEAGEAPHAPATR